jgi:hypothetical protein
MPDGRLIALLDPEARDLVVEALRADSRRRQRAATRAAAELHEERAAGERRDIRSGAVMVTNMLVDAARLDEAANIIEAASIGAGLVSPIADLDAEAPEERRLAVVPPPPADDDDAERNLGDALAESRDVLAELGLLPEPGDAALDFDDLATPEDDPDDLVGIPVELADLTPEAPTP